MQHVIRSGRVYLRPFERSDAEAYHRWRNDPAVLRLASLRGPMSREAAEARVAAMAGDRPADGPAEQRSFVICLVDGDRTIGEASLFDVDRLNGSAELGIFIGEKDEWGKGYGTDAVNALVDFGFNELRLERIHLEVWTENPRAIRSYQKAGFVHEGTRRRDRFEHGEYTDGHVMSILRDEWVDRRSRTSSIGA